MKTVVLAIALSLGAAALPVQATETIVANAQAGPVPTTAIGQPTAAAVADGGLASPAAREPARNPGPVRSALAMAAAVPEPALWAMMILGLGMVGGLLRRKLRQSEARFTAAMRAIAGGE